MTEIQLHGILGQLFGKIFKFKISNIHFALKALEANREGFFVELMNLSKEGYNYVLVVDGNIVESHKELQEFKKIKSIHFLPAICGAGPVTGPAAAIIGSTILGSTIAAQIVGFVINMLVYSAISLGVSLIAQMLTKQGSGPTTSQAYTAVAGITTQVADMEKSYIFNNNVNTASQGDSIPIGYGKYKIASKVLNAGIKSYPQTFRTSTEFQESSLRINSDFISF